MQLKAFAAAGALSLFLLGPQAKAADFYGGPGPAPAPMADEVTITIQSAQYYDDNSDDSGDYGDNGYDRGDYYRRPPPQPGYGYGHRRWIGCWRGAQMVDNQGFYRVRSLDCEAPVYTYRAFRNDRPFIVRLSARTGAIISVRRAYY